MLISVKVDLVEMMVDLDLGGGHQEEEAVLEEEEVVVGALEETLVEDLGETEIISEMMMGPLVVEALMAQGQVVSEASEVALVDSEQVLEEMMMEKRKPNR